MRQWLAAMVAGLLLAAAGVSALLLLDNGSATVATDPGSATRQAMATDDEDERAEDRGHGPPPWAHGLAKLKMKHHGPAKAAKPWKALSPDQRHDLMERLSREHAAGMKAFATCVKAGRDDCEKPLPPGQAKRR